MFATVLLILDKRRRNGRFLEANQVTVRSSRRHSPTLRGETNDSVAASLQGTSSPPKAPMSRSSCPMRHPFLNCIGDDAEVERRTPGLHSAIISDFGCDCLRLLIANDLDMATTDLGVSQLFAVSARGRIDCLRLVV